MSALTRLAKAIWETFIPSDPEPVPEPYGDLHERILETVGDWDAWQLAFDWLNVNYPEPGDAAPQANYLKAWEMVKNVKERQMGAA